MVQAGSIKGFLLPAFFCLRKLLECGAETARMRQ